MTDKDCAPAPTQDGNDLFVILLRRHQDQWMADALRLFRKDPEESIRWSNEFVGTVVAYQASQKNGFVGKDDSQQSIINMLACIGLVEVLSQLQPTTPEGATP